MSNVIKLRTFDDVENTVGCVTTHHPCGHTQQQYVFQADSGALQRTLRCVLHSQSVLKLMSLPL